MNLTSPITIVIADDHELIRNGFKNILENKFNGEIKFVAEAKNGRELIEQVDRCKPKLVLTDIQMPEMSGTHACRIIKEKHPSINIIAFSVFTDTDHIMSMIRAGAIGYLAKTSSSDEIIEAIRVTNSGKPFYCSTISDKLYGTINYDIEREYKTRKLSFSEKEIQIMQLICQQLSTKEIATQMKSAVRTIESHRYHIQEKIGARNMVGIALYALISGLVKVNDCKL